MKLLQTFLQEDGSRRYSVMVPNFIAEREDYPHYEKDRFASMEANLKRGDVLFDIGTETGWQSAIYAQFVGAGSMCLFEHVPELWPTIKQVWGANNLPTPLATYCGFVSNRTTRAPALSPWPSEVNLSLLADFSTWKVIHGSTAGGEATVDGFVEILGKAPAGLTIDVEGAEFRVLQGARTTLIEHRPLVWVSVHPEARLKTFGASKKAIRRLFDSYGYDRQYLGVDHEEHYFYYPRERAGEVVLIDSPWMTNGTRHETFEEKIPGWEDSSGMPYAKAWGNQ